MKKLISIFLFITSLNLFSQNDYILAPCLDSCSGKYGYVDSSFNFVIQPIYDMTYPFYGEIAEVEINDEWEYINKLGETPSKDEYSKNKKKQAKKYEEEEKVIDTYHLNEKFKEYKRIDAFEYDMTWAEKDSTYVLINKKNEILFETSIIFGEHVDSNQIHCFVFSDSTAIAYNDKEVFVINEKGELLIRQPNQYYYEKINDFYIKATYRKVLKNKLITKRGVFDERLNVVVFPASYYITPTSAKDVFWVDYSEQSYLLKRDTVISEIFEYGNVADNGNLIWAKKKGRKFGYIDTLGKPITDFSYFYKSENDFHYGLSPVSNDHKLGFINNKGELVIEYKYLPSIHFCDIFCRINRTVFRDGFCQVKNEEGQVFYIDTKGVEYIK